jgi:AcrR family transcriptional regulator
LPVPTQAERTEATRGRLIATARRLFAAQGFAATSTEEILSQAAVSRGALYHHFPSKTDLFQATFEQVEDELTAQVLEVASSGGETDPMRILQVGFDAFLDQCLNPEVQRIVMLDGPTVLGWDLWHELDERYAFGTIKAVLTLAADSGRIQLSAVDPLAHLLLGAIMQAGMVVARSDDPLVAKKAMTDTFAALVSSL